MDGLWGHALHGLKQRPYLSLVQTVLVLLLVWGVVRRYASAREQAWRRKWVKKLYWKLATGMGWLDPGRYTWCSGRKNGVASVFGDYYTEVLCSTSDYLSIMHGTEADRAEVG